MEIDRGETARAELKLDLEELNHNLTIHEEELYSTKIELNDTKNELGETQQELNDTKNELNETRRSLTDELN